MTREEFYEVNCKMCGSQRCYMDDDSIATCKRYKGDIDGIEKQQTLGELFQELKNIKLKEMMN